MGPTDGGILTNGEIIDVDPVETEPETEAPREGLMDRLGEIPGRILTGIRRIREGDEAPRGETEGGKETGKAPKKRRVKLQTLTYSEETEEYTLSETGTYFEDLPPEAVHVTGKKGSYFLDTVEDPECSDPTGIRATDLYLWMVNNDINEALAVKGKGLGEADIRRYIVIGIGLIIGVCVIYAMM